MEEFNFSVSMCVYKGDDPIFLNIAFDSIINQTTVPSEIVLTVDGPIPDSIEKIIEEKTELLRNNGIVFKIVRLSENKGHGEARRISFENCSCKYIALMDADDISVSDRFEKQIAFFKAHPNTSVVGGNITEFISQDNPEDVSVFAGHRIVPEDDHGIKEYMKKRCPMNQVTVMFKKEDVAKVGGYIDWYCEEDYYLWIRMSIAKMIFGNIPDNLVYVRVGKEMYRRRGGLKYFRSERKIQKLLKNKRIISPVRYYVNVSERFVLQVLMPNRLRGFIFQKLARS